MVSYRSSREHYGGLAQLGERLPCKQEVTSSTLVFSISVMSAVIKDGEESAYACLRRDSSPSFCLHAVLIYASFRMA